MNNENKTLHKCDPKKNTECRKTACQTECFFTTHKEYRANNKVFMYNWGIDAIEAKQ